MKKIISTILLMIIIFQAAAMPAYALNSDLSDAVITADEGGLVIIHDEEDNTEYFVDLEQLAPGHSVTRSYLIQNDYHKNYTLYLRAASPVSIPAETDIVNKIMLKITLDGTVVYDGTLAGGSDDEGNTLEKNILIGEICGDSVLRMKAEFYLDGKSIGNESQLAEAYTEWIWTAVISDGPEEVERPEEPGEEERPEEPGESEDPEEPGEDEDKITAQPIGPKTGDPFETVAFILAMIAAGCMLLAGIKKRQMKEAGTK